LPDREAVTNRNNFRKEADEMSKSTSRSQEAASSAGQRRQLLTTVERDEGLIENNAKGHMACVTRATEKAEGRVQKRTYNPTARCKSATYVTHLIQDEDDEWPASEFPKWRERVENLL
jgi:hypothetical protein